MDLGILVDDSELEASWVDRNPQTRAAIEAALPLEGDAVRWGDELYFRTPVDAPEEAGQTAMTVVAELSDVSPLAELDGGAHVRIERAE